MNRIPQAIPQLSEFPYRLMAPGPVAVHPEILKIMALPQIHHRTPEFQKILSHALERLKKVFQTAQPVFALTATGSGGMEAALMNTLSPGDEVLVLETGKFGERWAKIAQKFGMNVSFSTVPWGHSTDPDVVRKELRVGAYKAVLCQACETSTGALNPIREIGHIVRDYPDTLLIVDGITAVGATPLPMDEIGIDVLVAGSQKAFMLPTGLAMIALSEKAWTAAKASKSPKFYWDLSAERKANQDGQTHFSSNVSLIRGLNCALDLMLNPGLSHHLKRIHQLSLATRKGGEVLGLKVYPQTPSPSLTAFLLPEDVNGQKVRSHLEEKYNVTIAGGQDRLKGKIIRIGHMGAITDEDAVETVRLLGRTLHDLYPLIFLNSLADKAAETAAREIRPA